MLPIDPSWIGRDTPPTAALSSSSIGTPFLDQSYASGDRYPAFVVVESVMGVVLGKTRKKKYENSH